MKKKLLALLLGAALMVSGAASAEEAKEYIKNGDFGTVSYDTPLHWELFSGAAIETPYASPFPGEAETVLNGGVETLTNGEPDGWWAYYGPWNGNYVKVEKKAARTGEQGILLNGISTANMTAVYDIDHVTPGATYQFSGWGNKVSDGSTGQIGIALYDASDTCLVSRTVRLPQYTATNTWQQVFGTVEIPKTCTHAQVSCAVRGIGTLYFDDLSFYMIKAPEAFSMMTEDIFHYAERGTGKVHVTTDPYYQAKIEDASVDFSVQDEAGNTIFSKTGVAFKNGAAAWEYSVKDFVMQKPYTLSAIVKSNLGTKTFTEEIYKFSRPTALGADGTYYDENGEPFIPVIAYWPGDYARNPEIGINVAEILAPNAADTLKKLDTLEKLGMKALVSLFAGARYMMPAGHPENLATTIEVVTAIKDHPAVFAYAVQDEPFGGADGQIEVWLREAYRTIRAIDSRHPIYIVENDVDCYDLAGRMADVLAVDPYPYQADAVRVTTSMQKAREAVYGRKPVYAILQTFQGSDFFPTADNVREQVYRALEGGARGIGYYTIEKAIGQWGGLAAQHLYDIEDRWTPLRKFAEKEMPEILAHFAMRQYPVLIKMNEGNSGLYYEAWVKGEQEIYLEVHNRSNYDRTAMVTLESNDKRVKVDGFTAEAISLGKTAETVSGSTLVVNVAPNHVVFYKIVPHQKINPALLNLPKDTEIPFAGSGKTLLKTTENGSVISLPAQNARMVHLVDGLASEHSYTLSIDYRGSVQDSAQLYVEYGVKDEKGLLGWKKWSINQGIPYIAAQEVYSENFGKVGMTDWETVSFHITTPPNANAVKLSISAVKADADLKVRKVRLTDTPYNLVANGNLTLIKEENILTGGWTSYMDYPTQVGNIAELRQEGDRTYLYMTEAPPGKTGRSANARQKVYLYEDTVYKLSFLYKDMGNAPLPIICLNNLTGGGQTVETWTTSKSEGNGWTRYTVCFRPKADGAYTLWLGNQNAKGAYAYTEISLIPVNGDIFTKRESTVKGAGSAVVLDAISSVSEAKTEDGKKLVYVRLPEKEKLLIATYYGGTVSELSEVVLPSEKAFSWISVPTGGTAKIFSWKEGSILPQGTAVTFK